MQVIVNGEKKDLPGEIEITGMLKEFNVKMPDMVSVELKEQVIPRAQYGQKKVKEGDRIEFLYFMGGGAV
ncbi:MAG: sulfur carrier protein ThiS [bacterium]|nr:sulfur carrier protein ThiS [bacterium]